MSQPHTNVPFKGPRRLLSGFRRNTKPSSYTNSVTSLPLPLPEAASSELSLSLSLDPALQRSESVRLEDIPDDILHEVARWSTPATILRGSLTCKRLRTLFKPHLYHTVDLAYTDLCRSALKCFPQRPEITRWIQRLILKPNHPSGWANGSDSGIDERWIINVLEGLASQGALPALTTFKWYGKETPGDSLWLVLRTNCPHLRNIGTSVGQKTMTSFKSENELFGFRNLKGFHLFTQVLERWTMFHYSKNQALPDRMWKMLFESEDLEELTLDGTCLSDSNIWQLKPLLSGRWPRLQKLATGNVFNDEDPRNDDMMCAFLQAHRNLEVTSSLGNMSYSPMAIACLLSLPKLHTFRGNLQQLKNSSLSQIRNLILTDWFSPSANFGDILGDLDCLESLSVCVNFMDNVNHGVGMQGHFYDRLLSRCSQLKYLEISSTNTLSLRELSSALRQVPTLRDVTVFRVRKLNGTDVNKHALLIANQNPNLREFTIRDVSNWDHDDQLTGLFRTKQIGQYAIVLAPGGLRVLSIQESGVGAWRQHYSRNFTQTCTM